MRLSPFILSVFISISLAAFAGAQQPALWIPHGVQDLQQSASSKSGFAFDHSMLVFASKLDPHDADLRRVIAGVSGISVQNYHFRSPAQFDSSALNAEYRAAGWKQLMNNHRDHSGTATTDLWVRLDNNAISDVAILLARPNEINFVVIAGSISPADLSHLGGHFGIPNIEGGVVVPTTPH